MEHTNKKQVEHHKDKQETKMNTTVDHGSQC